MHASRITSAALLSLSLCATQGCKSKQEQALDQAKQQAAASGQAQQFSSVDSNGNATTTVVQPPQPGQSKQQVTTTTTSSVPAAAARAASNAPVVTPVGTPSDPAQPATPDAANMPPPPPAGPSQSAALTIAAGTNLEIRIHQTLSAKHSYAGEHFGGELVAPVTDGSGHTLLPGGTHVEGRVDAAHKRGHFKGRSILEFRLVSLTLNGQSYPIATRDLVRGKKGKGKRTAGFIGGGAGAGMLIGGLASGGTGLLIGGLSGAGAGTALAGLTGNKDIVIPAESVMRFRLADDLVL